MFVSMRPLFLLSLFLFLVGVQGIGNANEDECNCEYTTCSGDFDCEPCHNDEDLSCESAECPDGMYECGNSVCMDGPWDCDEGRSCHDLGSCSGLDDGVNCPDDVTLFKKNTSALVFFDWAPPYLLHSTQYVSVTFVCLGMDPRISCGQEGRGVFPIGVTEVMYNATEMSGRQRLCTFSVTVTDLGLDCPANVTVFASPGTTSARLNWNEPVLTGLDDGSLPSFTSSHSSGDIFGIGTHRITYRFHREQLKVHCGFFVIVIGQCPADKTTGSDQTTLTWQPTRAGTTTESVQRCPLMTTKGVLGSTRAVRTCVVNDTEPGDFKWGDHIMKSCGEVITNVTLDDIVKTHVTEGNAPEVAQFLANETLAASESGEEIQVDVIATILQNIVNASTGDPEVTTAVIRTVSSVVENTDMSPSGEPASAASSSLIVQSVQSQVSLTLQEVGEFSIQENTIHVEAISRPPSVLTNGLTFASVRSETPQGHEALGNSLEGTEIKTSQNTNDHDQDVLGSVQLPSSIAGLLSSSDGSEVQFQASFIVYANDALFGSASINRNKADNVSIEVVAGPVLSLTVENIDSSSLTEPVVIEFTTPENVTEEGSANAHIRCVSWDFDLEGGVGDWSAEGCTLRRMTNDRVLCDCTHLTNFAILVDIKGQMHEITPESLALTIISQVGCVVSILSLILTLTIYLSIRKLRSGKARQIFIHLCVSWLLLYFVFLSGVDNATSSTGGCVFLSALLHYLTLTTMMWMAVEARNMYVSTVKVFPEDTPLYMVKACLAGWGFPLIIVSITLGAATESYRNEHYCFISPSLAMYLGLLVPIGIILIHNIITFILVMRGILQVKEASRSQQISKRLQNAVGISTLMGLTWTFGFLAIDVPVARFAFQLIFCILNSLQGLIIFLLFCVRRQEVRTAVAPYLRWLLRCKTCRTQHEIPHTEEIGMTSTSGLPTVTSTVDTQLETENAGGKHTTQVTPKVKGISYQLKNDPEIKA